MLIQMLCSILIALDTSSLVYKGFCTSFVATLLGHHSWLRHSVMTQFNVATHDVQKPIYTREEVSNVILNPGQDFSIRLSNYLVSEL